MEITLEAPALEETLVARLEPKRVFGESAFFHASPHCAVARCASLARLVKLGRSEFDRLLEQKSTAALLLGANAADILAVRLQQTDHWIAQLLQQRQDAKVSASWRRFREHLGHSFEPGGPRGFFGTF